MKCCLSVGLHNMFFDIAIVSDKHEILGYKKCDYNKNIDISKNIYNAYQKYFFNYKITSVGVGISNNIAHKDDIVFSMTTFNFNRYNLKKSLEKVFKIDVYLMEETYLASLAIYNKEECKSLLYLVVDNKISNSIVIDNSIIELDQDLDLRQNNEINECCTKDALKAVLLTNSLDDDCLVQYFLSNNNESRKIIINVINKMNKCLEKIVKEIKVEKIVLGGYLGQYFSYFNEYFTVSKKAKCSYIGDHRKQTLLGISHLIFKDNKGMLENKF